MPAARSTVRAFFDDDTIAAGIAECVEHVEHRHRPG